MKKISTITMSLVALGLFAAGCAVSNSSVSDESLSLRKTYVQHENTIKLQKVEYSKAAPGEAKVIDRSFDNAPPMIPHSVDGLVPVTMNNNSCLGCHMPEVAKSVNATAIPISHFTNFRPTEIVAHNGKVVKVGKIATKIQGNTVYATPTHGKLYAGRYNCTQCHVVQSNAKLLVKNTFTPGYRSKDGMKKSSLIDNFNEGVKTVK